MKLIIVVPCYNEEKRLNLQAFLDFAGANQSFHFLFVDDGSKDGTSALLSQLCSKLPTNLVLHRLEANTGKAEAVRIGMQRAFAEKADAVGFLDADLSTPLDELPDFVTALNENPERTIVIGSRVKLLGRNIERRPLRHYLGRVFATVASQVLRLPVYDTQCGAKLFRSSAENASLFSKPFGTRWIFDVEILARLIVARRTTSGPDVARSVYEHPLRRWIDVPGSKVRPSDFLRAIGEMWKIHRRYFRNKTVTSARH